MRNRWRFMKRRCGRGFRRTWRWERRTPIRRFQSSVVRADSEIGAPTMRQFQLIILTPPPAQAPHSSLVHMFETVRQKLGGASVPASRAASSANWRADGSWTLDFDAALAALNSSLVTRHPSLLLGTAFSFVHLLDYLAEKNLRFDLPAGSRVMETGGYKNRSRSMPKAELHQLITERLGVPPSQHHLRIRHERVEFAGLRLWRRESQ